MHKEYLDIIETAIRSAIARAALPPPLAEPIAYALGSGGKRLRPLFTLLSAEACGSTVERAAPAAAAIEILHNFTLIHDDIMDRSPLRRGKPTVYVQWNDATAILAGDTMMGIAYQLLVEHYSDVVCRRIVKEFSSAFVDVCIGQAEDLAFRYRADVTMDDYIGMITRKTARLFATATVVGGLVASASEDTIAALRRFGTDVGIAFQIQDDILDLFGEPEFGKERGQDLREGKKTFPILLATQYETVGDARTLLDNYLHGMPCSNEEDIETIAAVCRRHRVLEDARAIIDRYLDNATATLEDALPPTAARISLQAIAEQTRHRRI